MNLSYNCTIVFLALIAESKLLIFFVKKYREKEHFHIHHCLSVDRGYNDLPQQFNCIYISG